MVMYKTIGDNRLRQPYKSLDRPNGHGNDIFDTNELSIHRSIVNCTKMIHASFLDVAIGRLNCSQEIRSVVVNRRLCFHWSVDTRLECVCKIY